MTDIERAHALVKAHYPEIAASYTGSPVQIALAAIQSERARIFAQQAMAVDIEIVGSQNGGGITEDQGQAAMNAAWPYVEKAIHSERERANVLVEALRWYGENTKLSRLIHSDRGRNAISKDGGIKAETALAAYGDGHE